MRKRRLQRKVDRRREKEKEKQKPKPKPNTLEEEESHRAEKIVSSCFYALITDVFKVSDCVMSSTFSHLASSQLQLLDLVISFLV